VVYNIPAGGINGFNTSCYIDGVVGNLAASTTYYVYLFNNSGTLTIEFSTTGHQNSASAGNVGVRIKNGDNSRSLIGFIRTNASAQFQDDNAKRYLLSWFNQQDKFLLVGMSNNSTSVVGPIQIGTSTCEALNWAGQAVMMNIVGQGYTTAGYSNFGVWIDGTGNWVGAQYFYTSSVMVPTTAGGWNNPSEGNHVYAGYYGISNGTGTVYWYNAQISGVTRG
jgi:hypothetical protein